MKSYQPKQKSFEYYIQKGYEYASGKPFSEEELLLLEKISDIDTSIIKIDDILDHEEYRNRQKCIHLVDGIEKTIINARLDEISGVHALTDLIDLRNTFSKFSYEILKVFNNKYMRGIYTGQLLDRKLEESVEITNETLNKYFTMARSFTGGHIRYGIEIGQLLAGKIPNTNISNIAELLGINRQIIDDFEDYFKAHHNPFGDIRRGAKRIPEILFVLAGGNREEVLDLIDKKNFEQVIKLVLNQEVRRSLFEYCQNNLRECKKIETDFDWSQLSISFEKIIEN